jgi:anti-sigma B factor antagonist
VPQIDTELQDGLLVVQQADEGARVRLALKGELDLSNAPTVESSLEAALLSGKAVLVDLGKLEFIDSTGIALLVTALNRRDAWKLGFLPSETAGVRRVLSLTGLEEKLPYVAADEGAPATDGEVALPAA